MHCVCVCVCVCPCCQPPRGGHGNTALACLVMWLIGSTPDSDRVVETRQSQGSLVLVLWHDYDEASSFSFEPPFYMD